MAGLFPLMVSFGIENSLGVFRLYEIEPKETFQQLLLKFGPEDWEGGSSSIGVKVSHSKSASFDRFNLGNTVDLARRILKTDVLWVKFERTAIYQDRHSLATKSAFQVLFNAQNRKTLPDKIANPFNQKLVLFNKVLSCWEAEKGRFSIEECSPRMKNKKTGEATQLAYDVTDILWRVKMAEGALRNRSMWSKVPAFIQSLLVFENKSKKNPVVVTQASSMHLAVYIHEVADRAIFSDPNFSNFKVALLTTAGIFEDLTDGMKANLARLKNRNEKLREISSATEAVVKQIGEREKVTLLEKGTQELTHPIVISIVSKLLAEGHYKAVNISTILPVNRNARSAIVHRSLPNQIPVRAVVWSFENSGQAPQSMFAFSVPDEDDQQQIYNKIAELKGDLQNLQKFYFPKEFYQQFHDQAGSVTGISKQNFRLLTSMVMGDDRKMSGDLQDRFAEAIFSSDPDLVYDLRLFNGRKVMYEEFLAEFRIAMEEFMVEDRGRHEVKYDDTIVSKVSVGFSLGSVFKQVCDRVKVKNPNCAIPQSESFLSRYLIPRTKAAAESASVSQPLIPLKLVMQQKVIEKPNCDAYYNASQYKYLRSYVVELGNGAATMIGWDDKTGVDVGEPEQPTAATQNPGKSWVHSKNVVGEGQHSFHKTNLTPSVRLLHDIPDDVTGSFYRGAPQVCIKDAIFEHSTSARHATELSEMLKASPELVKPVLVLTNDGGVDHTIRHARNVVAMLAVFLHFPDVLLLINFQMAAYRSAYHPVEKINCLLNLTWNGVCLSRDKLSDPVLEDVFAGCSSMAEGRKLAVKHPGLQAAVKESISKSIKILEDRATQGSLKGNFLETFDAATSEDINEFLAIIKSVDKDFDVEEFMDKKKPYHYTPDLKSFIDSHVTFTHYAITFKRHGEMDLDFLKRTYPEVSWKVPLEALPCPEISPENKEKFKSYEEIKKSAVKDYTDKCRPGAGLKTPTNIPFPKNKVRAQYGEQVEIICDKCEKRRVVYFQQKPTKVEVSEAKNALKNTLYICGGRVASFGRSLAVMEETSDVISNQAIVDDEIDISELNEVEERITDDSPENTLVNDEICSDDDDIPVQKKPKICVIDSDESSEDELFGETQIYSKDNVAVSEAVPDRKEEDEERGPCYFCRNFETGHKCKLCSKRCCNICNKVTIVEEMDDNICPECFEEYKVTGLNRAKKTEQSKDKMKNNHPVPLAVNAKKQRGRPRKMELEAPEECIDVEDDTVAETIDENDNIAKDSGMLTEWRILGGNNILTKIFVSESLTCDDPVEAHLYDILGAGKVSPCFYCGELDQARLFSLMTEDSFPLCQACQNKGRGAGARRKSRVIKPKAVKAKTMRKAVKKVKLID